MRLPKLYLNECNGDVHNRLCVDVIDNERILTHGEFVNNVLRLIKPGLRHRDIYGLEVEFNNFSIVDYSVSMTVIECGSEWGYKPGDYIVWLLVWAYPKDRYYWQDYRAYTGSDEYHSEQLLYIYPDIDVISFDIDQF